jgi:glycosyltransferase involved in cell wall biosynthesis
MAKASVALCGIVRNEIRSVVEWLAHYKALGFTEFLIYDNDSTDGTADVLRALDDAGELIYLDWPHAVGERPQRRAYEHARQSATADWLAFFDVDEFLLLHHDDSIGAFLARFDPAVSGIAVNWVVFGSGGEKTYRPLPVIERFFDALPDWAALNRQIKAIGRRRKLEGSGIHRVAIREGKYVNPSGAEVEFEGLVAVWEPDFSVAVLHHYSIKSIEEFEEKRQRGHANSQDKGRKREKLDRGFAENNAGGEHNTDMLAWSGRMRAEAMRLRDILAAAGLDYPVWPFVEAGS